MESKIIGCWICYNNALTIRHSIESVAKYLDEVVIIDGSFDGRVSTDGTWQIVENMMLGITIPVHHVASQATTLYDKHNEHVRITGNNDPNVWTWQVDSDEVYLPEHAKFINDQIRSNQFNGIAVQLTNVNRIEEGVGYTDDSFRKLDTFQMRIYRMQKGLHFETRDNIFEHIVYNDGSPVQTQENKIAYMDPRVAGVFNYHCLEPFSTTVNRYKHYKVPKHEEFARHCRSIEKNNIALEKHPLQNVYYRA